MGNCEPYIERSRNVQFTVMITNFKRSDDLFLQQLPNGFYIF